MPKKGLPRCNCGGSGWDWIDPIGEHAARLRCIWCNREVISRSVSVHGLRREQQSIQVKLKMKDWLGRYVLVRSEIQTRGGETFPVGTVMIVDGHYRGRLKLMLPGDDACRITGVARYPWQVTLLNKRT